MRAFYPILPFALAILFAGQVRAEGVSVQLNHAERLSIHGAAANVVVGNSAVADVSVLNSHTLYVVGRNYGSTAVLVTDALGRAIYSGDVTVGKPASGVAIYRGVTRADYACAPGCSEAVRAGVQGSTGAVVAAPAAAAPVAPPIHP